MRSIALHWRKIRHRILPALALAAALSLPGLAHATFHYDAQGRPVWYPSSGAMTGTTLYQGRLLQYAGGQTLTGGYRPPASVADLGQITLQFAGPASATLTLPNGTPIALSRFTF